jgi:hypothetical protein
MRLSSAFLAVAALVVAAGCSSGAATTGSGGASAASAAVEGAPADGEPVRGEVRVAWRNLDPSKPKAAIALVNESSEDGRKLKSGRATSSEIRVLSDVEMGALLEELDKVAFFENATEGLGLDNAPDVAGRRGVVVVTRDGRDKGIMLTTNLGTSPVPKAYVEAKRLLFFHHGQVPGAEVKARVGAADETIFESKPIPPLRRR